MAIKNSLLCFMCFSYRVDDTPTMFLLAYFSYFTFCIPLMLCSIGLRPAGWLDRLVQYHRGKFIQDVNDVAPVKIQATLEPLPPGYTDSSDWDFESVMRLLHLLRKSEQAAPVRLALRRALRPTRRMIMSRIDSFKHFPSLSKDHPNEMYYDMESSDELYDQKDLTTDKPGVLDLDSVIVISNPVEARLPSAKISVRLLKEIMEARAKAARVMPSTKSTAAETSVTDEQTKIDNATEAAVKPDQRRHRRS